MQEFLFFIWNSIKSYHDAIVFNFDEVMKLELCSIRRVHRYFVFYVAV